MPFLMVRTAYGLLYAFQEDTVFGFWNPLFGSAPVFGIMALLPEYIVLWIYIYLGFYRIKDRSSKHHAIGEDGSSVRMADVPSQHML
jgi:hypothetical protein